MAMDIGGISPRPDYSSLFPRDKGIVNDNLLTQWTMLRANGKALKAAINAEQRGYLRAGDAPSKPLLSDKLYNPKERSVTATDVLRSMGLPTASETAAKAAAEAAAEAGAEAEAIGENGGADGIAAAETPEDTEAHPTQDAAADTPPLPDGMGDGLDVTA